MNFLALKMAADVMKCEDYSSLEDAYCWDAMDEMAKLLTGLKTTFRLEWYTMLLECGGEAESLALEEDCLQSSGEAEPLVISRNHEFDEMRFAIVNSKGFCMHATLTLVEAELFCALMGWKCVAADGVKKNE